MTSTELAAKCLDVARNYRTLYVNGCFGAPLSPAYRERYCGGVSEARAAKIRASDGDTFGFDCVCLIKGILWGWRGDKNHQYGGAVYASNGVPDIGTGQIIGVCSDVSTDFGNIAVGELLWMEGHVGIYVGDGLAVECTSKWDDCVQVTACNRDIAGYNRRNWTKHGRLPYVSYEENSAQVPAAPAAPAGGTIYNNITEGQKVNATVTVLKRGAKGLAVQAMQTLLNLRTNAGLAVDGSFGAATDAALRNYQSGRGLAVDGSCGGATWSALCER